MFKAVSLIPAGHDQGDLRRIQVHQRDGLLSFDVGMNDLVLGLSSTFVSIACTPPQAHYSSSALLALICWPQRDWRPC